MRSGQHSGRPSWISSGLASPQDNGITRHVTSFRAQASLTLSKTWAQQRRVLIKPVSVGEADSGPAVERRRAPYCSLLWQPPYRGALCHIRSLALAFLAMRSVAAIRTAPEQLRRARCTARNPTQFPPCCPHSSIPSIRCHTSHKYARSRRKTSLPLSF